MVGGDQCRRWACCGESRTDAVVTTEDSSNPDGGLHIPAPYLDPTSPQSAGVEGLHSENRGAEHLEEAASTRSSVKPGNCGLALRDMLELRDSYDLIYAPKIWTVTDERNLKLMESAEVSELVPSRIALIWPCRGLVASRIALIHAALQVPSTGLVDACECAAACKHAYACRWAVRPAASEPSGA